MNPQPHSQDWSCPILSGPTASGKTSFALHWASQLGLEIINADSLLVYRGFDIGTAKPTREEQNQVPHHLIDCCPPETSFTAAEFVREVERLSQEIHARGRRCLIVGGTPFYLKALCFGVWDAPPTHPEFRESLAPQSNTELHRRLSEKDPQRALQIHSEDRYRVIRALEILEFSPKKSHSEITSSLPNPERLARYPLLWIDRDTEELEARIRLRTEQMLEAGLIEETERLRRAHPNARALKSVGYQQVQNYLDGAAPQGRKIPPGKAGLSSEISLATRQLVKSQRTFLKSLSTQLGPEHARRFLLDAELSELESALTALYTREHE